MGNFQNLCSAPKRNEYSNALQLFGFGLFGVLAVPRAYLEWRQALLCGGVYKVCLQGDGFVGFGFRVISIFVIVWQSQRWEGSILYFIYIVAWFLLIFVIIAIMLYYVMEMVWLLSFSGNRSETFMICNELIQINLECILIWYITIL